jgi:hypothetical protein
MLNTISPIILEIARATSTQTALRKHFFFVFREHKTCDFMKISMIPIKRKPKWLSKIYCRSTILSLNEIKPVLWPLIDPSYLSGNDMTTLWCAEMYHIYRSGSNFDPEACYLD